MNIIYNAIYVLEVWKTYGLNKRILNCLMFFSTWDKEGLVEVSMGIHMFCENQGTII